MTLSERVKACMNEYETQEVKDLGTAIQHAIEKTIEDCAVIADEQSRIDNSLILDPDISDYQRDELNATLLRSAKIGRLIRFQKEN